MYTQCPECESAFRVTAEVLKQAAGMVRCGNCGHAFNSLAYLSESKPEAKTPDPSIPELKPEPSEAPTEPPPEPPPGPRTISAEQSAALLKTLDQLAGEDVRIEDTGVEWRVLDDDDVDDEPMPATSEHDILSDPEVTSAFKIEDAPPEMAPPLPADAPQTDVFEPSATVVHERDVFDGSGTMVDELLDETPTPVDEFLAPEPDDGVPADMVDLGSLLDDLEPPTDDAGSGEPDFLLEATGAEALDVEPLEDPLQSTLTSEGGDVEEIELESTLDEDSGSWEAAPEPTTAESEEPAPAEAPAEAEIPEQEPPAPAEPELRFDDNTPLPEDFLDDDAPSVIDTPPQEPAAEVPDPEALQEDLELGKADEWQALLEEFGDLLATDLEPADEAGGKPGDEGWAELSEEAVDAELARELDALDEEDAADDVDAEHTEHADVDEEPTRAAETAEDFVESADDRDESAIELQADDEPAAVEPDVEDEGFTDQSLDEAAVAEGEEVEEEGHDEVAETEDVTDEAHDEPVEDDDIAASDDTPAEAETPEPDELVAAGADEAADDSGADGLPVDEDGSLDLTGVLNPDDDGLEDHGESDREPDDAGIPEIIDVGDDSGEPEDQSVDEPGPGHPHYVPPPSEEEQTINMLIDQDLLAIAHEDEDGFTSTIVFEAGAEPTDVDSIVMEGSENTSSANDDVPDSDNEQDIASESAGDEPEEAPAATGSEAASEPRSNVARNVGLGAAAAVLVLALVAQAVHKQRAELATDPRFGGAIMGIYETLGMPVTPEWDVSSWRIEKTQGSTDDSGRLLTIYAQLGNQGDTDLPYPTITVSVTDRYQESLGSVVVDPADYLANSNMAAQTVAQGTSFEATIPIAQLSPNAEGYLLNACYRQADGPLRCAKEDFR